MGSDQAYHIVESLKEMKLLVLMTDFGSWKTLECVGSDWVHVYGKVGSDRAQVSVD